MEDFLIKLAPLGLSQPMLAVAILWWADRKSDGASMTPGELARAIHAAGLGNPHSTKLGDAVFKTKHVLKKGTALRIKPASRNQIADLVATTLEPEPPRVDQEQGFIPKAVWIGTRGYVENIAQQINGCYQFGFYDGVSVLTRRLIETLLIECYEHLKLDATIKKSDGNYPMLSDIIVGAVDKGQLTLGRDTKKVLKEIKTLGDRSAHNRRYTAVQADLDKVQMGVRLAVDELLHLAGLK